MRKVFHVKLQPFKFHLICRKIFISLTLRMTKGSKLLVNNNVSPHASLLLWWNIHSIVLNKLQPYHNDIELIKLFGCPLKFYFKSSSYRENTNFAYLWLCNRYIGEQCHFSITIHNNIKRINMSFRISLWCKSISTLTAFAIWELREP